MRHKLRSAALAVMLSGALVGGGTAIAHAATASPSAKASTSATAKAPSAKASTTDHCKNR